MKWIKKKTGPATTEIKTAEALAEKEASSPVILLGYFKALKVGAVAHMHACSTCDRMQCYCMYATSRPSRWGCLQCVHACEGSTCVPSACTR